MSKFWIRSLSAALAMLVVDLVFSPTQNSFSLESIFWNAFSNLLISITMNIVADRSFSRGLGLALSLWLISFTIGTFNILLEAFIFNVTNLTSTFLAMTQGAFKFLLMAVIISYAFPKSKESIVHTGFVKRGLFQWAWRVGLGVLFYLIFYIVAGMILQASLPELTLYYQNKMPGLNVILFTQIFRGFIFVGIAIFIQSLVSSSPKIHQAVIVGLIFSILGGVAPLIPPNNLMPALIRLGHGFEVGISNFLFGVVTAFVLYRSRVDSK